MAVVLQPLIKSFLLENHAIMNAGALPVSITAVFIMLT